MRLTSKQEKFCQGVAAGLNQSDAFREVYRCENWKEKSIWERASVVAKNYKVASRIESLKAELAAKLLWTREQSVKVLANIANGETEKTGDRIAAVRELNTMHGWDGPASSVNNPALPVTVTMIFTDMEN